MQTSMRRVSETGPGRAKQAFGPSAGPARGPARARQSPQDARSAGPARAGMGRAKDRAKVARQPGRARRTYRRAYAVEVTRFDWRHAQYVAIATLWLPKGPAGYRATIRAEVGPDMSPITTVAGPVTEY